MTPEQWQEIERLYYAALQRNPTERGAFLNDECVGDPIVRQAVESLLAGGRTAERFLGTPALEVAANLSGNDSGPSLIGGQFGSYEVRSLLGAGAMGAVYRARDVKLGREVAIKVLPKAFMSDPDRLRRFEREARVLAMLNHPHIATIYGLEEAGGARGLIMELVEGETLAERIARGPVLVGDALPIAAQIAEALEAAHDHGVVHRDLKPANIKITPKGVVKVLDFGLAKAITGNARDSDLSQVPTIAVDTTREGLVLGTAPYMSPEQARGNTVDNRADIWAFGCVLYEMLTARRAFDGAHMTDFVVAVMTKEPDWTTLSTSVPLRVVEILKRCLKKNLRERLRHIGDARIELEELIRRPELGAVSAASTPSRNRLVGGPRRSRSSAKKYKFDAFLSYSPTDVDWAIRLKTALQERGLNIWLDQEQIRPGNSIIAGLEAGLEMCKACVLVVSRDAVRSQWVSDEYHRAVTLAKQKNRPLQLVPVILGKAELPGFLSTRNWVEFLDDTTFEANLERLIWGITGTKRQRTVPSIDLNPPAEAGALTNPYIFERPAIGQHFFGRRLEMTRLINALKEGRSVVVYGLQRVGKTSLVKEALDRELKPSNVRLRDIRIDMYESCETLTSYIDFFETMIDRFCDELNVVDYKKVREEARQILRTGNDPGAIRGLMRNLLRGFASRYGRALLFIDEFQDIKKAFEKAERQETTRHPLDSGFIRYLGSLVKEGYLQLLCCGRYQIQLLDNKLDTQLLKLMVPIELSILDESSARHLIEEPVRGRFSYEPAAVDHILTLSGRYPYVVQYLCYELVERARNENRSVIRRDDVTAVIDVVQEPQVRLLYSDFQELEGGVPWRLLLSIAYLAADELEVVPWENIFRLCEESFGGDLDHTECSQALKLLTSSQILGEQQTGDTLGYFVRPDLLRIWLRRKNFFFAEKIASRTHVQ
jgi:serine/threonine protein kinase